MKRKIILMLLLFFTFIQISNSQANKYGILIETSLSGFLGWNGSHGGNHSITFGSKVMYKGVNTEDETVVEYDFFYVTDNPSSIICRGRTVGNRDGADCNVEKTIPYNNETFDIGYFGGCIGSSEIMGIYLPQPVDTKICESKSINLSRGWNWQYSYDSFSWNNFPSQYQAKRNISFQLNDLIGYEGKLKLYVRTGYQTQFTSMIIYDIIPCSPKINYIAPQNTTCSYNKDGSFLIEFGRTLTNNEKVNFNLFKFTGIVNNQKQYVFLGDKFNQTYGNDKLYHWPDPLEKGEYYIKYQLAPIGEDVSSEVFTIVSPSQLKFEIKKADNPTCAGDPAEISIAVSGGTGDYKFYVDGVEKTNPKPVKEVDGFYHIRDLTSTAVNNIKVMDGNNCIEKSL